MSGTCNRREFLAAAGTIAAAVSAGRLAAATHPTWRNWAGNLSSQPGRVLAPRSEDEVVDILRAPGAGLRPVGSGHSWSGLVPTDGTLMSLDRLSGLIDHDPETLQAEVWAGTKLHAFGPMLEPLGQALQNMSDINYQTLAGAVATSTHGTGARLGCMSDFVTGLRLVTPQGQVLDLSADREAELFNAARNSLGALGVVTRLRFQNRATHRLHQREWLAPTDEVLEDIDTLIRDNQQFELFPLINSNRSIVVVTNEAEAGLADHIEDSPTAVLDLKQAFELTRKLPFGEEAAYNTALDLAFGPPTDRIGPSYRVLAHPRTVRFVEMEYTVPAEQGVACLRDVLARIRERAPHVCFPLEYRYIKGDDTMIGMFSGQDGCAISVHQFADSPDWLDYFSAVEPVFHRYGGRPHWGKWHSLRDSELAGLYPQWQRFKRIRRELDPAGLMLNSHLRELFGEA